MENYGAYIDPMTVRNLAVSIVLPFADGKGGWNYYQPAVLFDYVKENIQYIPDPLGMDYVAYPSETLNTGGGDCEDQAILLASLCEAVGIPSRLVFCRGLESTHVLCQVDFGFSNMSDVSFYLEKYYASKFRLTPDGFYHQLDPSGRKWLIADPAMCRYFGDIQPLVDNGYIDLNWDRRDWWWRKEINLFYPNRQ